MPKKIIGKVALTARDDWSALIDYDRLDVVMDSGIMYIAKQDVPKGTPTSDPNYWMRGVTSGGIIIFDTAMSDFSTNGVENKVVKAYVDDEVKKNKDLIDELTNTKADKSLVYDNIGKGSYNLIPYPYFSDSAEKNGITFTVNSDGSIVANGTATADAYFNVDARADDLNLTQSGKEYKFTGCPSNGSINTYYVAFTEFANDKSTITQTFNDVGNGIRFTSMTHFATGIVLWIKSGQTVTNLTFKPMLVEVDSDGSYPTEYQRYIKPNADLDETKSNKQFVYDSIGDGSYNLIPYPYDSNGATRRGITFTTNADGSITANGTVDSTTNDSYFVVVADYLLKKGTYVISDGSSKSASNYCWAIVYDAESNSLGKSTANNVFTIKSDTVVSIQIRVYRGITVSKLVFKPMLVKVDDAGYYPTVYKRGALTNNELTNSVMTLFDNINALVVHARVNAPDTVTVAANGTARITYNITKSGYTPVGIIGYYYGNQNLSVYTLLLSNDTTAIADISNRSGSSVSIANNRAYIDVLYIKSNLASAQILEDLVNTSKK